jgi:predicted chitinase
MLTVNQLGGVMPRLPLARRQQFLPFLNEAMLRFEITTRLRAAAFLAQLAHESGELRFLEEIWGPTAAQRRYEPPGRLADRLGNTQAGDGERYKGRGPIQITGRFNYARYGELLGLDLVADPALAATPAIGFATAGLFWFSNRLNERADDEDFAGITRRINGGLNGLSDRERYFERARQVLADSEVEDAPADRSLTPSVRWPPLPDLEPLTRGHEFTGALRKSSRLKRIPGVRDARTP